VLPYRAGNLEIAAERGGWRLTLANAGNARTTFGLHASDEQEQLEYSISPPSLELAPGERGQALLRARPRRDAVAGVVPFRVEARAGDGPPLTALGSYRAGGRGFGAPLWALAAGGAALVLLV
jgi:hypothetical protein